MTFTTVARAFALQESLALRGYATAGRLPPRHRPPDLWAEWQRISKTSPTTFRKKAA